MSTDPKIYTAAEVASVGFSKEVIEKSVAYLTQRAYKEAKRGGSSIAHGADRHLLHQIAHRLRELGYAVQFANESTDGSYITVRWDNAKPTQENNK